jgi:hypothetical protein
MRPWLVLLAILAVVAPSMPAGPPPWHRTESRQPCAAFDPLREPFFGDIHVHTGFSHDARLWATTVTPADAYAFAKGGEILLPDRAGALTRAVRLERPLDFVAVTDHAEFLGEVRLCTTPGSGVYDEQACRGLRTLGDQATEDADFIYWGAPLGIGAAAPHDFCDLPGVDCAAAGVSVWQEIQAAAEEAYDRTSACAFTSFIGYENTASPLGSHLHRNVIFRNEHVPAVPASYLQTQDNGSAQALWSALERDCLDAGTGCEALTIPHNSNLSGGMRWPDPVDAADARRRQLREPLVEIFQHKGGSECRFDRLAGLGTFTADERCSFEQDPRDRQGPFPRPPVTSYPRRNMVRNTLKDGLAFEQRLDVNPFRLGFVGGTDTHDGTPGNTEEKVDWPGHQGSSDADVPGRLGVEQFDAHRIRFNPGGLAVAWAEENSRDAIFAALARRETYATSGTRPIVRFFAGELPGVQCGASDWVERAYAGGTPMGGEIGAVRRRRSPRFAVWAAKDPGSAGRPGTDLERVQIVKGWADARGETHEQVFDVAGGDTGATVDHATCAPVGTGARELCAEWEDASFDAGQHAFYYVRVLENPTCRWSTLVCKAEGVDPFAPDCAAQAAAHGGGLADCCLGDGNDAFFSPVVQERAWTSPIWYRPEAIAAVRGGVRFGRTAGRDVLKLALRLQRAPAALDPATADITLRVADDDDILAVTIPAGALKARGRGLFAYRDRTAAPAGLASAKLRLRRNGEALLKIATRPGDFAHADRSDHVVTVTLGAGVYEAVHARRWHASRRRLEPLRS